MVPAAQDDESTALGERGEQIVRIAQSVGVADQNRDIVERDADGRLALGLGAQETALQREMPAVAADFDDPPEYV